MGKRDIQQSMETMALAAFSVFLIATGHYYYGILLFALAGLMAIILYRDIRRNA